MCEVFLLELAEMSVGERRVSALKSALEVNRGC